MYANCTTWFALCDYWHSACYLPNQLQFSILILLRFKLKLISPSELIAV